MAKACLGCRLGLGNCCLQLSSQIILPALCSIALQSKKLVIWVILVGFPGMHFTCAVVTWAAASQDGSEQHPAIPVMIFSHYHHGQPCCCKARSRLVIHPLAFTVLYSTGNALILGINGLKVGNGLGLRHHFRIITGTEQNVGTQTHIILVQKTRLYFPGCQLSGFSRY